VLNRWLGVRSAPLLNNLKVTIYEMINKVTKMLTFYDTSYIAVALNKLLSYFIRFHTLATSPIGETLDNIINFSKFIIRIKILWELKKTIGPVKELMENGS